MPEEVELKLLLDDEHDFERVRAALDRLVPRVEVAEQVNYYLDTVRLDLRRQGAMVRVRVANGRAVVTGKAKATITAGVQRAIEREHALEGPHGAEWQQAGQPRTTPEQLQALAWLCQPVAQGGLLTTPLAPDTALHTLGAMANVRRIYRLHRAQLRPGAGTAEVTLELDHSRYSAGAERFEIELEHPDAAELALDVTAFLDALEVTAEPATESKYAQFLRLADGG